MKNKVVTRRLVKEIMEAWATTTSRAKPLAESLKSKMQAVKTRLIILSLLSQDRKTLLGCISNKCGALLGNPHHHCNSKLPQVEEDHALLLVDFDGHKTSCKAIVHSGSSNNNMTQNATVANPLQTEEDEEQWRHLDRDTEEHGVGDDKHLTDLKNSLEFDKLNFDLEDEEWRGGSGIEPVKGEELIMRQPLEDEIDEVADLFIRRFHRQMRIEETEAALQPTEGRDAPAKPL